MQNIAKGLDDLEKQIRKNVHAAIEEALETDVCDAVRGAVIDRVHKDVYGVYTPKKYIRRKDEQGLSDANNVVHELRGRATNTKSKTLTVWNIAKHNPRNNPNGPFGRDDLQKTIIDGWSKVGEKTPPYGRPRPFIENANKALELGGEHRESLERAFEIGLGRHGIVKTR